MIRLYRKRLAVSLFIIFFSARLAVAKDKQDENFLTINQMISDLFSRKGKHAGDRRRSLGEGKKIAKCGTQLMRAAKRSPEKLWPENRFILHRPDEFSSYDDYYGYGVTVLTYDTQHFRLHYTIDNSSPHNVPHTSQDPTVIPSYVVKFGTYFEQAWTFIIDDRGYRPTPDNYDDGKGGNNAIDVYIMDIDNCFGYTTDDWDGYLYIVVNNNYNLRDYIYSELIEEQLAKVTAVHEFFHVIQNEYDHWVSFYGSIDNCWWEETTAVWMEDELYDEVNDYLYYLGEPYDDDNYNGKWDSDEPYYEITGDLSYGIRDGGWFDFPHRPLDYANGDYEYGNVIWGKYLSENFGFTFIKRVFEENSRHYDDYLNGELSDYTNLKAIKAIEYCLVHDPYNPMSLADAVLEFRKANIMRDYEEGEKYPPVAFETQFTNPPYLSYSHESDLLPHGDLEYLASHYVSIVVPEGSASINISVIPEDDNWQDFAVLILGMIDHYDYRYLDTLKVDSASEKTGYNQLFDELYRQILVIPVNTSIVDSKNYSVSYSVGDALLAPVPKSPSYNQSIRASTISLTVINSASVSDEVLIYEFELYNSGSDLSSQNCINSNPNVAEGEEETSWFVGAMSYNTAQVPHYYWRCRVRDGENYSAWTSVNPFSLSERSDSGDNWGPCFINIVLK